MPNPAIEIRGIEKRFADRRVLCGLSAMVDQGAFALLAGPSGTGKTTLLRCIAGLERPDAGSILLEGRTVSNPALFLPPEKRGVAFAFQDFALWPHMSVLRHLRFVLSAQSVPRTEHAPRIEHALQVADLADRQKARPHELSGGEQQRLGIARALVSKASILLLDEPFANLDEKRARRILEELHRRVREEGHTVLVASHDSGLLDGVAGQTIRLDSGATA